MDFIFSDLVSQYLLTRPHECRNAAGTLQEPKHKKVNVHFQTNVAY